MHRLGRVVRRIPAPLRRRRSRPRTARPVRPRSSGPWPAAPPAWPNSSPTPSSASRVRPSGPTSGSTPSSGARPGGPGSGRWALSLYDTGDRPRATAGRRHSCRRTERGPSTVDGVVLAVPATEAAVLLAPHAPMAAGILSTIEYASVAVITLSLADGIHPGASARHRIPGPAHLDHRRPPGPDHRVHLPRTRSGRTSRAPTTSWSGCRWAGSATTATSVLDDDQLSASAFGELAQLLDIRGAPLDDVVTRWDRAFPQYRVGHLIRVAKVEEEVAGPRRAGRGRGGPAGGGHPRLHRQRAGARHAWCSVLSASPADRGPRAPDGRGSASGAGPGDGDRAMTPTPR